MSFGGLLRQALAARADGLRLGMIAAIMPPKIEPVMMVKATRRTIPLIISSQERAPGKTGPDR
ncbi:MAG TPA: hypothetical protein VNI02_25385 [Blastocatellia bacterium]|nr:hypothetical protein [Blastocatellia bacterium]